MRCYADSIGVPYIVSQRRDIGSFWDKQMAVLKQLPMYDWVLYVDTDTYVAPEVDLAIFFASVPESVHYVFSEAKATNEMVPMGARNGADAGVFAVRNSDVGKQFLIDWVSMSGRNWVNHDNGAINTLFLRRILGEDKYLELKRSKKECDFLDYAPKSAEEKLNYFEFFGCFYYTTLKIHPSVHVNATVWSPSTNFSGPLLLLDWNLQGTLSSYLPSVRPMVYHNKDTWAHYNKPEGEGLASQLKVVADELGSRGFSNGEVDKRLPLPASPPTFIHIPKTGGSSVEETLLKSGIKVGSKASANNAMDYPTEDMGLVNTQNMKDNNKVYCSPWHRPPSEAVPNSFVVVRNPKARLQSEFRYTLKFHERWYGKVFEDSCDGLSQWFLHVGSLPYRDIVQDCHLVPQWAYAKHATTVLPFSMIENGAAWKVLEHMYGEELNPETANVVGPGTWDANDEDCLSENAEKEFLVLGFFSTHMKFLGVSFISTTSNPTASFSILRNIFCATKRDWFRHSLGTVTDCCACSSSSMRPRSGAVGTQLSTMEH
ncbi:hypothetical protein TeGR_g9476, partial [Tetraparma gracilis]